MYAASSTLYTLVVCCLKLQLWLPPSVPPRAAVLPAVEDGMLGGHRDKMCAALLMEARSFKNVSSVFAHASL